MKIGLKGFKSVITKARALVPIGLLFCLFSVSNAQNYNDYGSYDYNSDYGQDSTTDSSGGYSDYSENGYEDYDPYGSSNQNTVKKKEKKPYVRFVPPYDSTRELVVYQAIIEVKDREGYEVEIDTIYGRAKKWLEAEFGKDLKKVVQSNEENSNASEQEFKIKIHASFPCIIKPNEFVEVQNGTIQYDMEIRVRDGRYRYSIKNLVHVADPRPGEKEGVKTYFEYLMKTKDDIVNSDQVLIAADRKITTMMNGLKKACETAPIEEEDDW
ncbi:MAG: DUF4468 domain-containing protein [Bacteroidetes bacterium]|nr:DUF4468 domain-containing protein [Bacteroidota bacterium]